MNLTNLISNLETILRSISDVLTAAIAITAFSLLIFAFTYRLRDRLTFSFTIILVCITIIFASDAVATIQQDPSVLAIILRIHWSGIIFLPAAYFNFSDTLLTFTGKPSRGRRKALSIFTYLISIFFLLTLTTKWMVGEVVVDQPPAPFLHRTPLIEIFTIYFVIAMLLAWYNLIRTINRSATPTSRRRMIYLVVGALGPAVGSFPYLLYGSDFAARNVLWFWLIAVITNAFVGILMVVMSYAVAFFGMPWPDRVVKSRLFRWVLRGPITASLTLGAVVLVRRFGEILGLDVSALIVLAMVGTIVLFELLIILFAPFWERIFFSGNDKKDLEIIRTIEDRMLTQNDLNQFLEMILATVCDRVQAKGAFLAALNSENFDILISIGKTKVKEKKFVQKLYDFMTSHLQLEKQIEWNGIFLISLYKTIEQSSRQLIGVIGVTNWEKEIMEEEHQRALNRLASRAALALNDRHLQEDLLFSLEILTPQVSVIQNLLAAGRYNRGKILAEDVPLNAKEINQWVKDALTHLWGGPKLSQSPLLQLQVIQKSNNEEVDSSSTNKLRDLLSEAIQILRPSGERQYTNEWILFNILQMKFIEGMKVKDIARRLALSEADLYRKQRVAISAVAEQIIKLEQQVRQV